MKKYKRLIIFSLIIALAFLLIYEAIVTQFPDLWVALKSGKEQDIENFLMDSDRREGTIFLALLQIIQVVSIVIPSAPIQIAGGMVYGFVRGYILCHFSYVFANCMIIFLLRRFSGLSELLDGSNKVRIQKALEFINQGDPIVIIMILCMLPLIPNGLIPYAASQMDIRIRDFALAVFIGSLYPVVSMVLCGKFILTGDYIISGILVVFNVVAIAIVYKNREKLSKAISDLKNKIQNKTK